ncbi:uncharacterized protein LOC125627807 [Caretta caretta]|uniref:uncharacterized protein LOC125627807 n=1 Tax=Caretta caretta TaxID=8467 RepID=UPI003F4B4923
MGPKRPVPMVAKSGRSGLCSGFLGSAPLGPTCSERDPPRGAGLVVGPASSPARRGARLGDRLAPARRGGRGLSRNHCCGPRGVSPIRAPREQMSGNSMSDPRRPNKVLRYKPPSTENNPTLEDPTPDYMNLLGMIFSMCGLMLKVVYLCGGDVLSPESPTHVPALVKRLQFIAQLLANPRETLSAERKDSHARTICLPGSQ